MTFLNSVKSIVATVATTMFVAAVLFLAPIPAAHAYDFERIASGGLGDAENNYPHSMTTLKKCLFVGGSRSWPYRVGMLIGGGGLGALGLGFTEPVFPDVPKEQAQFIPPAPGGGVYSLADREAWANDMAAKIFRYCERGPNKGWTEVYQSQVVTTGGGTQFWPVVHGYRWAKNFKPAGKGPTNKPAAYFGGGFGFDAESGGLGGNPDQFVSISRLLVRTFDGENFEEVPTPFGMGSDASMMVAIGGRFCVSSTLSSLGAVIHCTTNGHPQTADDWELVASLSNPPEMAPGANTGVFSIEKFKGHLWAGASNDTGWQLWKCEAAPANMNPGCWKLMVAYGGGDMENSTPADLEVFKNHLYVGQFNLPTNLADLDDLKAAEIYRVNNRGKCQLVVGDLEPHTAPPNDANPNLLCNRNALSGLSAGYGNPYNIYTVVLRQYKGMLFAGSLDISDALSQIDAVSFGDLDPDEVRALLEPFFGHDLWVSFNGKHFFPLNLSGFDNGSNFWLRTIQPVRGKVYFGSANAEHGFEVYRSPMLAPQLYAVNELVSSLTDVLVAVGVIDQQQADDIWINASPW